MNEAQAHAHVPAERAELFETVDGNATETEYLELLQALIRVQKPERCLETGTYEGHGTRAIVKALVNNGRGHLATVETDIGRVIAATKQFQSKTCNVVHGDSLAYLAEYRGAPFDFVFLDSHIPIRPDELRLLCERQLLAPEALIAIHDTSRLRTINFQGTPCPESAIFYQKMEALLDQYFWLKPFTFPYSRGMMLLRAQGWPPKGSI